MSLAATFGLMTLGSEDESWFFDVPVVTDQVESSVMSAVGREYGSPVGVMWVPGTSGEVFAPSFVEELMGGGIVSLTRDTIEGRELCRLVPAAPLAEGSEKQAVRMYCGSSLVKVAAR